MYESCKLGIGLDRKVGQGMGEERIRSCCRMFKEVAMMMMTMAWAAGLAKNEQLFRPYNVLSLWQTRLLRFDRSTEASTYFDTFCMHACAA